MDTLLPKRTTNKWLNLAVAWELAALALVVYAPALNEPFVTFPLAFLDCLIAAVTAPTVSPVLELAKWMERQGWFGKLSS